jgi:hypothetical protein
VQVDWGDSHVPNGLQDVSDQELLGKLDYWQPPEDFEKRKKGDCEDFALWTWRQLLDMGYGAPLVAEYLVFWSWFWLVNFFRPPRVAWTILRRNVFRRELWL